MNHIYIFNSIIGAVTLVEEECNIVRVELTGGVVEACEAPTQLLREAEQQITDYLNGHGKGLLSASSLKVPLFSFECGGRCRRFLMGKHRPMAL